MNINVMEYVQQIIRDAVKKLYDIDLDSVKVEHPDNSIYGDYSSNISLILAKRAQQSPMDIANKICYELNNSAHTDSYDGNEFRIFDSIDFVAPGFINLKLSKEWLKLVSTFIIDIGNNYGSNNLGGGRSVMVEYSQPNPNKAMHIGHARNNFIGSSLSAILSFCGYSVVRVNYMNDWGTHICKSMLMYKKYGNNRLPDKKSDHFVGDFYAMYEKDSENNPELEKELAELFRKMESMDDETLVLWKKIVTWAYEGWQETYKDQGVGFDVWMYQSNYKDTGKEIVNIALQKGIAEKDPSGAVIARLEKYGIPDKVLLRSDGTSIYSTQDLQLAKDSFEKYNFDKRLYVVDARQSDYFKQIFKILQILGFDWADRLFHIAYGFVRLPEGAMSSRKGMVVNADEVFAKIRDLEEGEITSSIKSVQNKEDTVKKIAMAAFKYGILKIEWSQDIIFRYDQVTRFEGNTGPYLLYTYARMKSIMEKAGLDDSFKADSYLYKEIELNEKEVDVLRYLYQFPEFVRTAAESFAPNEIANYLYNLAQKFNSFYAVCNVLDSPSADIKDFRLMLTKASGQVLKNGLMLLGIETVEKM